MRVSVLGTGYIISKRSYDELTIFKSKEIDGYCDGMKKEIVYLDMLTHPSFSEETQEYCTLVEKEILRHEITHAFLNESGLCESSGAVNAWARNEEMVDWIALQFPKMLKAFQETDCL